MEELLQAIENIIEFIEVAIQFVSNIFKSITLALGYIIGIIPKVISITATLPSWLLPFATITIGITIAYFIINRKVG